MDRNRKIRMLGAVGVAVVLILTLFMGMEGKARLREEAALVPQAQVVRLEEREAQTPGQPLFSDLRIDALPASDGGFSIVLPADDAHSRIAHTFVSDRANRPVVHVISRILYPENSDARAFRYDAAAVDPETRSVDVFPIYEISSRFASAAYAPVFGFVDDLHLAYVVPREETDGIVFDIARMNVKDGTAETVVSGFHRMGGGDADDFFVGVFLSADRTSALLNSFQGGLWRVDFAGKTATRIGNAPFRAYGDPGSRPPRSLVYPSEDLQRFIYEDIGQKSFVLLDGNGERLREFRLADAGTAESPGIRWGPGGRYAMVEYARSGDELLLASDNGLDVFAQGVAFVDREGRSAGQWELPDFPPLRFDVFGWADERKVVIAVYRPRMIEGALPERTEASYKLLDISRGRVKDLKEAADIGQLDHWTTVAGQGASDSSWSRPDGVSFLLMDPEKGFVWLPPHGSSLVADQDGAVTMQMPHAAGALVHRFDPENRTWKWLASDAGENRDGIIVSTTPFVHRDERLVYVRTDRTRAEYLKIADMNGQPEGVPPELPETFSPEASYDRAQLPMAPADQTEQRALGISRFGEIALVPQEGERAGLRESGRQYIGDYGVVYRDRRGRQTEIGEIEDLLLFTDQSALGMERLEYEGFDLLLFKPIQYPYVRSWDGNIREIRAFIVTEGQKAFAAEYTFKRGGNTEASLVMAVDDNVRPVAENGNLILTSVWNGGTELAFRPNPVNGKLTLVQASSVAVDRAVLWDLVNAQTEKLEQALRLEEAAPRLADPEWEALKRRFASRAWNNKGFQKIYQYSMALRNRGDGFRAFAWNPLDYERIAPDTVRFTFALNLFYAIGQAAHLEVCLKWRDGEWTVYDLGTLSIQPFPGDAPFAGQVIPDRLEVD